MKTFLILLALAGIALSQPAAAQRKASSEPLRLYDSTGKAVGHYLGFAYVSLLDGSQRVEAYFPYGNQQPTDPAVSFLHESSDCSGTSYNWVDESKISLGIRLGWIFQSGILVYPAGEIKTTSFLSFKYMLANGTFRACEAIVHDPEYGPWVMTVAPLKVLTVGQGPFTVK